MNTENFKGMSVKEQNVTYGGWAWLVALVPLLTQSIVTIVGAIKTLQSSDASIETTSNGHVKAKWGTTKTTKETKKTAKHEVKRTFYAY